MWHVSTSLRPGLQLPDETLREIALNAIQGVGDEKRGQIADERGRLSYQVRRRLSAKEEAMIPGGACDIRRTAEAERRFARAQRWLRPDFQPMALEELLSGAGA